MDRVFVATDGSEGGMRAVAFAAHLAAAAHARLTIVTVASSVPNAQLREYGRMEHMSTGDLIDMDGQSVLRDARARAQELGAAIETCHVLIGDPAEQILDAIADYKPNLLVVGRRGRGRLERLLLGSVSQKLASLSSVPIAVVP